MTALRRVLLALLLRKSIFSLDNVYLDNYADFRQIS